MRQFSKGASMVSCIFTWIITLIIAALTISLKISPDIFSLNTGVMKSIYWAFWGGNLAFLLFYIYYQADYVKRKIMEILTHGTSEIPAEVHKFKLESFTLPPVLKLFIPLMAALNLLIVYESFLLIEKIKFLWILIVILVLIELLIRYDPDKIIITIHASFIKGLQISFAVFTLLVVFSTIFYKTAGFIDRQIFSNLSAMHGSNYDDVLEEAMYNRFNVGGIEKPLPRFYLGELNIYSHRLEKKLLKKEFFPARKPARWDKSIHDTIVTRTMESFIDNRVQSSQKNRVMEGLLDYLTALVRMGHRQDLIRDSAYTITPLFIERLLAFFQNVQLTLTPGIRQKLEAFYESLSRANINAYELGKFLGKEVPAP